MPEKNSVVAGGMPVMIGTRKVAPNMATTCCIPTPMVSGQLRRSSGPDHLAGADGLAVAVELPFGTEHAHCREPFRECGGRGENRPEQLYRGRAGSARPAGVRPVAKVTPAVTGRSEHYLKLQLWKATQDCPPPDGAGATAKGKLMTIAHEEAVIDAAAVDAIFAEARTANAFTGEVTEDQARAIYELTKFGPTAFNSQPLRVTYVRSEEARATLVAALIAGNRAKTASAPLVADPQLRHRLAGTVGQLPARLQRPQGHVRRRAGPRRQHRQQQRPPAGRLLHPRRPLPGLRRRPDDRRGLRRHRCSVLPCGGQKSFLVVNIGQPGPDAWGEAKPKFAYEDVVRTV